MRINIPTKKKIVFNDVRALYIIDFALRLCGERMIVPTLQYFADKYGYELRLK